MNHDILAPINPDDPFIMTKGADDVLKLVNDLKEEYEKDGKAILPREFVKKEPKMEECGGGTFTIMQFNLLAEGLSSVESKKPPMDWKKKSQAGGFDALEDQEDILDFHKRRVRIVEEIIRVSPSLLTVQECDHYTSFFQPVLSKLGYKSTFQMKKDSPCKDFGYYSDGVGIFWKEEEWVIRGEPSNGSSIGPTKVPHCICTLSPVPSVDLGPRPTVVIATTHLKSKSNDVNEETRRMQVEKLCGKVRLIRDEVEGGVGGEDTVLVIAGDFNADPVDLESGLKARAVPQVMVEFPYVEHCYDVGDTEGVWTTWKRRGVYEAKHNIDYIFVEGCGGEGGGKGLVVREVWDMPKVEDMRSHRLPCWTYPSDHISIAAKVEYVNGGGSHGGKGL